MIINVTGGPDLSLIEVSEASAIIQEAAHEDANIIFGAVVDPKMEGKVKITVIATGFDRGRVVSAAAERLSRGDAGRPAVVHLARHGDGREGRAAGWSAARRATVVLAAAGPGNADRRRGGRPPATDMVSPGAEFEPVSPLDVPAFLRRQHEA